VATTTYLGTLQYDSGSSVYVDVGELVEFDPPLRTITPVQNSHLASPSATHTAQAGFIKPGEVPFKINFKKADYNTLNSHFTGRANRNYRVRYNDGSTATNGSNLVFEAFVSELGDEKLSTDATNPIQTMGKLFCSGPAVFQQGS